MLRKKGHEVVLLEKETFPRFRIGESLLAASWDIWEDLGVRDEIERAGFPVKRGVNFSIHDTDGLASFAIRTDEFPQYFIRPYTFHVDRARYDEILINNARANGVDVRERCAVFDVLFDGRRAKGVRYRDEHGRIRTIQARCLVDASGRSTVLGQKLQRRYNNPELVKIAYYTHFANAGRYTAPDGSTMTEIHSTEGGWLWYIGLRNGVASVGIVLDRDFVKASPAGPQALFDCALANNQQFSKWLSGATQAFPLKHVPSISYLNDSFVGDGFVMIGDAAMFIDPIFSAGVALAHRAGHQAAECVSRGLYQGNVSTEVLYPYEQLIRRPLGKMYGIISNWYRIMATKERNHIFRLSQSAPLLREQLVIILSGGYDRADMDKLLGGADQSARLDANLRRRENDATSVQDSTRG
jgi:halogenation protein CepH